MFAEDTLKDKTILITGGGSGLGFAMAKRFAELGARVAICGRSEKKLQKAVDELQSAGSNATYYRTDVRDYDAVGQMFKKLIKDIGSLEGLVNNAAGNFYCPSEDLSPNGFKAVVDIVLHGTFNCSQHFGKYLIDEKRNGSILNIVTTYTETGSAFVLPSACAKAGVYAMTNTLAYEWATYGIRVNSIAPGPFPTEGAWQRLMPNPEFEKTYLKRVPTQRYGDAEELSNLAVFLMSDLASYITGECVTIDGGERLQGGQFNFITQMMPRDQLKEFFARMRPKR
ncbi:MAG: SDR family oxidoreductase [Phycisphaerae bacterium]|nr:SDR family oxidoreductase [Phycisphaerae bacterium]NIU55371.1 SDR family oxidoreductase [Phycisphaerae bacterium]NIW91838.1 SDR family oxidoreductase [Phycisphaerae bacterium]